MGIAGTGALRIARARRRDPTLLAYVLPDMSGAEAQRPHWRLPAAVAPAILDVPPAATHLGPHRWQSHRPADHPVIDTAQLADACLALALRYLDG